MLRPNTLRFVRRLYAVRLLTLVFRATQRSLIRMKEQAYEPVSSMEDASETKPLNSRQDDLERQSTETLRSIPIRSQDGEQEELHLADVFALSDKPNKRPYIVVCILSVLGFLWMFSAMPSTKKPVTAFEAAGNSTLGFNNIYAITTNTTWRVQGLAAAADLTDIDIELFYPRKRPEEEVTSFRTGRDKSIGRGKALAWLAHLDMIDHIVAEGDETALVLEDDVDWDVYVREQMRLVSKAFAVRKNALEGNKEPGKMEGADAAYPYGMDW